MKYSDNKLLQELQRCYSDNGKVTANILNSSENNYPSQPTYTDRFGSMGEAKRKAGIQANITKDEISEAINEIIEDSKKVSLNRLEEKDISPGQLYAHFESIEDAISFSIDEEADKFYKSKYSSVIENLDTVSVESINNCEKLPSYSTVNKYFDGINEMKDIAGIRTTTYNKEAKRLIEDYNENIDYSSDGYIYSYKFDLHNDTHFYVGETTDIVNRMSSHLRRKNIQTKTYGTEGEKLSKRGEESNNITIEEIRTIITLDKGDNESPEEFTRRRLYEENKLRNRIVLEEGTLNVYGG